MTISCGGEEAAGLREGDQMTISRGGGRGEFYVQDEVTKQQSAVEEGEG